MSDWEDEFQEKKIDESLFEKLEDPTGGSMAKFIQEYEKLQQALKKSHQSENRFIKKCRELTEGIKAAQDKSDELVKKQEENRISIESLNNTIASHKARRCEVESEVQEKHGKIKKMREELERLNKKLENSAEELFAENERTIGKLESKLEALTEERDKHRAKLTKIRRENIKLFNEVEEYERMKSTEEEEIRNLERKIAEYEAETQKEIRRREELEQQAKDHRLVVNDRNSQIALKTKQAEQAKKDHASAKIQLKEAEGIVEKHSKEHDELAAQVQQLEDQLIGQQDENEATRELLDEKEAEVRRQKERADLAGREATKKKKLLEALQKKMHSLEMELVEQEALRESWQQKVKDIKEQIATAQEAFNANAKQMDICVREREILSQSHLSKLDSVKAKETAILIAESTAKSIENEIRGYEKSITQLNKVIGQLQKDKESYEDELRQKELLLKTKQCQVDERNLEIVNIQKEILTNESKLRQQQNLLEAVRADRNMYNKTMTEQKQEMQEYRRKFETLTHSIQQLKAELLEKDNSFVAEHFNVERVDDEVLALKAKIEDVQKRVQEWDETIETQKEQIQKLKAIISEADSELKSQTKQYNDVVNEQRVLSQQLVARNAELENLYEKLRLQSSMFKKGEEFFKDRAKELTNMREVRDELLQRLEELEIDHEQYGALKAMIGDMENELVQEQLKVRALKDELKKPINVHRWRQLMDTNGDTYGMIQRIQKLHKQIISKSKKIDGKDDKIKQTEKLYVDLRRILARQPGNEAREQLRKYAEALQEKKAKYKVMKRELSVYQSKVYEYKYDIEKLQKDVELVKLAYFQKKREELKRAKMNISQTGTYTDSSIGHSMGEQSAAGLPLGPGIQSPVITQAHQVPGIHLPLSGVQSDGLDPGVQGTGSPWTTNRSAAVSSGVEEAVDGEKSAGDSAHTKEVQATTVDPETQETTVDVQETTVEAVDATVESQDTTVESQETTVESQESTVEPQEDATVGTNADVEPPKVGNSGETGESEVPRETEETQ
eukprot:736033_1